MKQAVAVIKSTGDESMYQCLGSRTRERFPDCTNLAKLVERSPTHSVHMVLHGQCAVDQYAKIVDVRLDQHCTGTKVHPLDVDFLEIEGTSQLDELRLVRVQFKSIRRHPFMEYYTQCFVSCLTLNFNVEGRGNDIVTYFIQFLVIDSVTV